MIKNEGAEGLRKKFNINITKNGIDIAIKLAKNIPSKRLKRLNGAIISAGSVNQYFSVVNLEAYAL